MYHSILRPVSTKERKDVTSNIRSEDTGGGVGGGEGGKNRRMNGRERERGGGGGREREVEIPCDGSINVGYYNLVIVVPVVKSALCSSCTLHKYKYNRTCI